MLSFNFPQCTISKAPYKYVHDDDDDDDDDFDNNDVKFFYSSPKGVLASMIILIIGASIDPCNRQEYAHMATHASNILTPFYYRILTDFKMSVNGPIHRNVLYIIYQKRLVGFKIRLNLDVVFLFVDHGLCVKYAI
uniref:Uncharacterized protein n=1 Tax=Glossina palpalis gambiensis TaxID=67801 RepID=A0A1B0B461_9MUSC